ncbi:MAG: YcxB family protein [Verrucomicrobia bacterium]|nr:YcxB family protein [Verrucomicrobiota bacterium]
MTNEPTSSSGDQAAPVVLTLPLHFEIIFDKEADRKFVRLIHGGTIRRELAMFWMRNHLGYAGMVLGIYSALINGMVLTACLIVTLGVWLLQQHRVVATAMAEARMSVTEPLRVSVEINEEGVVERYGGVEARFGWSAMHQWLIAEDILYIQLTNGAWAWLPAKDMEPALRLEDLASLLTSKGVLERKLEPGAAKSRS